MRSAFDYQCEAESCGVPFHTAYALAGYVVFGEPVGDFLSSVLSNNLRESIFRADNENLLALSDICRYIYNYIPADCSGNVESVTSWIKRGGLSQLVSR
jgi:hypothetical protein